MVSQTPIKRSIVLESKLSAAEKLWEQVESELGASRFTDEDIFAVHLALEEAFLNAIKHGNKMDPAKKVKVHYTISANKFEIYVQDQGGGFSLDEVPDPRHRDNLYKPDGRGLLLIHAYMNVVEFNKTGNGLHMIRYKQNPPLAESANRKQP